LQFTDVTGPGPLHQYIERLLVKAFLWEVEFMADLGSKMIDEQRYVVDNFPE
jgi:hypothetical protein